MEAWANAAVRWFGNVLGREEDNVLREILDFEVHGKRRKGIKKNMAEAS